MLTWLATWIRGEFYRRKDYILLISLSIICLGICNFSYGLFYYVFLLFSIVLLTWLKVEIDRRDNDKSGKRFVRFSNEPTTVDDKKEVRFSKESTEVPKEYDQFYDCYPICSVCSHRIVDVIECESVLSCQQGKGSCSSYHAFCIRCVRRYIMHNLDTMILPESLDGIQCLEKCDSWIRYSSIKKILPTSLQQRVEERLTLENVSKIRSIEKCKDCNYAMEIDARPQVRPYFNCTSCGSKFCRVCQIDFKIHDGKTCDQAQSELARKRKDQNLIFDKMTSTITRKCQNCGVLIFKTGGCNKVICRCGNAICYLCNAQDIRYRHFDLPGPCQGLLYDDSYRKKEMETLETLENRVKDL